MQAVVAPAIDVLAVDMLAVAGYGQELVAM